MNRSMNYKLLSVSCTGGTAGFRPRISFLGEWLYDIGFIPGALVQALPEPDGMAFHLCNENIRNYSSLLHSTQEQGGNLIRVYLSAAKGHQGAAFVTSGQYIYSGGLSVGDAIAAKYDYGIIRVRKIDPCKLGFENIRIITVSHITRKYTNDPIPKVRLCGEWLDETGFIINSLATAASEQGIITLNLQAADTEYSALMEYVRKHRLKIIQVSKEPHNRGEHPIPCIGITGSAVGKAGFETGDILVASYQQGIIRLQKPDFEKLGF